MRYFAMLDSEEIVYIGEYSNIIVAFEHEPPNTHWVLDAVGLAKLQASAGAALAILPY